MTTTNLRTKRNRIIVIVLIAILALIVASVMAMTSVNRMSAYASEYDASVSLDRHPTGAASFTRRTPTLEDNFAGNRVTVTLSRNYSDGAMAISSQSFKTSSVVTAQCVAMASFSNQSADFSESIVIDSIRDMMPLTSPSAIFDLYTRVLSRD